MQWHAVNIESIFRELDTKKEGLTQQQAEQRLSEYGTNELKGKKKVSPYRIIIRQFEDVLIIILLIATILSAATGKIFDASLILIIVIFSAILGFIQEYQAEKAVDELKKILSPSSTVLRGGEQQEMPSSQLVPGDIIVIESGDRVPADARLFGKNSLKANESSLTGESVPVDKSPDTLPERTDLADRTNMIYSGTDVIQGQSTAVVVSTGMETELGRIAGEVSIIEDEITPLQKRTAEIGKWFGIAALGICFVVAATGILKQSLTDGFNIPFAMSIIMFAVALAVAAVPEALAGIVTGTLAIGMREMAKRNAIIRKMPAVETLGSVTVICSDKTGTITRGEMTVRKVYSNGEFTEITGTGYNPDRELKVTEKEQKPDELLVAGVLCNDSSLEYKDSRWDVKGDPTEGALLVLASKAGYDPVELRNRYKRRNEITFSSERKRMTTINMANSGSMKAYMKGAPEVILDRCKSEKGEAEIRDMSDERRKELKTKAEEMANEGLRVLAFACRELGDNSTDPDEVEQNMVFLGFTGMIDPAREEAVEAVGVCKKMNIRPVMITGDHKLTAKAIAKDVGIFEDGDKILTGAELDDIPEEEYTELVEKVTVYARVSPMHKLRIIEALKNKGHIVAMTGDGVNDAPALKKSDIGIAMGITGTDVSKEASDMILADDNFATILKAIEQGRWIYDNIKKYLTYLIEANLVEVIILGGIAVIMGTDALPLLPAAILYINLVTDGLPAIALGISPADPDIMQRPPRAPSESVFSIEVKTMIMTAVIIYVPLFYWVFFRSETLKDARTSLFFLFIIIELVIALNLRSLRYSIFRTLPHRWLVLSVAATIVITFSIVQLPEVREAFGVGLPDPGHTGLVIVLIVGVTAVFEISKMLLRKKADTKKI